MLVLQMLRKWKAGHRGSSVDVLEMLVLNEIGSMLDAQETKRVQLEVPSGAPRVPRDQRHLNLPLLELACVEELHAPHARPRAQ